MYNYYSKFYIIPLTLKFSLILLFSDMLFFAIYQHFLIFKFLKLTIKLSLCYWYFFFCRLKMKSVFHLFWRGILLFLIGTFFTVVLNLLQSGRYSSFAKEGRKDNLLYSIWWLPILCGTGSGNQLIFISVFFQCFMHVWVYMFK